MPDMTAIASALSSFKAMKDLAEAMIGLRDAVAFRERQIEFQGKIYRGPKCAVRAPR
jgi:hypothetical protein